MQTYDVHTLPSNDNVNAYAFSIELAGRWFVSKGAMIAYYGQMNFTALTHGLSGQLLHMVAQQFSAPLHLGDYVVAEGQGKLIIGDRGYNINAYDLDDGNLTIRAANLLAFQPQLSLQQSIVPHLTRWADTRERHERVEANFGNGKERWNEELVLQRYELLHEAGLIAEAGTATTDPMTGMPMRHDHRRILATGIARLRAKIKYRPVVFELMPPSFTLLQLQRAVEAHGGVIVRPAGADAPEVTARFRDPAGNIVGSYQEPSRRASAEPWSKGRLRCRSGPASVARNTLAARRSEMA